MLHSEACRFTANAAYHVNCASNWRRRDAVRGAFSVKRRFAHAQKASHRSLVVENLTMQQKSQFQSKKVCTMIKVLLTVFYHSLSWELQIKTVQRRLRFPRPERLTHSIYNPPSQSPHPFTNGGYCIAASGFPPSRALLPKGTIRALTPHPVNHPPPSTPTPSEAAPAVRSQEFLNSRLSPPPL